MRHGLRANGGGRRGEGLDASCWVRANLQVAVLVVVNSSTASAASMSANALTRSNACVSRRAVPRVGVRRAARHTSPGEAARLRETRTLRATLREGRSFTAWPRGTQPAQWWLRLAASPGEEVPLRTRPLSSTRSQQLASHARRLIAEATVSELRLWSAIRGRQLGVSFRRQVVLGESIVDFLAPSVRVVVEVDGAYHSSRQKADARRDARLERLGYRVLRIEAALVMRDLPAAVGFVRGAVVR